jgi:hypothetical protein
VAAAADERAVVDMADDTRMLHPQPRLGKVPIEPAFEDYLYMLYDTCDAVGIECSIFPMMGDISNAVAYRNEYDAPVIVYDRRLSSVIGGDGAEAVIAHELGHHYCQHLTKRNGMDRRHAEKEADAFMGFAMKKRGLKLSQVIETYERLGLDRGSSTHPPFEERAVAISLGYSALALEDICPGAPAN